MGKAVSPAQKAKRTLLGIEVPRDELALAIAIPCLRVRPPLGMSAGDALDKMEADFPGMGVGFRRAADAAVLYFHECINAARQPS